jgi:hypothetical protein
MGGTSSGQPVQKVKRAGETPALPKCMPEANKLRSPGRFE